MIKKSESEKKKLKKEGRQKEYEIIRPKDKAYEKSGDRQDAGVFMEDGKR